MSSSTYNIYVKWVGTGKQILEIGNPNFDNNNNSNSSCNGSVEAVLQNYANNNTVCVPVTIDEHGNIMIVGSPTSATPIFGSPPGSNNAQTTSQIPVTPNVLPNASSTTPVSSPATPPASLNASSNGSSTTPVSSPATPPASLNASSNALSTTPATPPVSSPATPPVSSNASPPVSSNASPPVLSTPPASPPASATASANGAQPPVSPNASQTVLPTPPASSPVPTPIASPLAQTPGSPNGAQPPVSPIASATASATASANGAQTPVSPIASANGASNVIPDAAAAAAAVHSQTTNTTPQVAQVDTTTASNAAPPVDATALHQLNSQTTYNRIDLDTIFNELSDDMQNGGDQPMPNTNQIVKKRCSVINKNLESLKTKFYSNHNYIKLISLTANELIDYFTLSEATNANPKNKLYVYQQESQKTTAPFHKTTQMRNFLTHFLNLTFINANDFYLIQTKHGNNLNDFINKFDKTDVDNSSKKANHFKHTLDLKNETSENNTYIYVLDFFKVVQNIFGNETVHAKYLTDSQDEYTEVLKEVMGRIKTIVEYSVGLKPNITQQVETAEIPLLTQLFEKMDIGFNTDFVTGIDTLLKSKSDSNILTFLKFRGTPLNNNARFNIQTNNPQTGLRAKFKYQNLFVQYNDDNVAYYDTNGSPIQTNLQNLKIENNILKVKDDSYAHKYFLGKFTRVFTVDKTNAEISNELTEVLQKIEEGKTVFMVGYGASGAGKTSTLIQLNTKNGDKVVTEPGIIMHLCNALGAKYSKLTLRTTEIFKSSKLNEGDDKNDDIICLKNPQPDASINFVYNGAAGFVLSEKYEHTNQHTYRNNQNTTFFNTGATLGSVLIHLIDVDRFVKATPNNPQSSRSHVLAYLQFADTNGDTRNLVVGDFAGVENAFECAKPEVLTRFSNLKRNASDALFYKFSQGEDPDPVGNKETRTVEVATAAAIPFPIFDFDNIVSFNRGNETEDASYTGYSYAQFEPELKNVDNLKQLISFVKNPDYNTHMERLTLDLAAIQNTDSYIAFAENVIQINYPKNADSIEKQMIELQNKINNPETKKYSDRKDKLTNMYDNIIMSMDTLNFKQTNITDTFSKFKENTDNNNLKNLISDFNSLFPKGQSLTDKDNNRIQKFKENIINIINYINTNISSSLKEKIIPININELLPEKPIQKGHFITINDEKIKWLMKNIITFLIEEATNKINSFTSKEQLQKEFANVNKIKLDNDKIITFIDKLKRGNCPTYNDKPDLQTRINELYSSYEALFGESIPNFDINKEGCIDTLRNEFTKKLATMFANPDAFTDTIAAVKQVTDNIIAETQVRNKNIGLICKSRTSEGQFINGTLKDLRKSIQQIVAYRNKDVLNVTPDFITGCLNEYCPARNGCFKLPSASSEIKDTSVIINDIATTLFNNDLIKVYDQLLVSVLCVVNLEKTANNPPPVPYVDINTLKKMFYYRTMFISKADFLDFLVLLEKTIEKLNDYADKLADIIGADITRSLPGVIKTYRTTLTLDAANFDTFKTDFELLLNAAETNNPNTIKLFIESIDNSNAASAMGTLEFVDSVSKFNSVENICLKVNDENAFLSEGFIPVIPPTKQNGGIDTRRTRKGGKRTRKLNKLSRV